MRRLAPLLTLLAACTAGGGTDVVASDDSGDGVVDSTGGTGSTEPPCDYPAGATEPMTLGEVITPYSWPKAIHGDGREAPLDLGFVPCFETADIDWSPFDVLLFVSIPAW